MHATSLICEAIRKHLLLEFRYKGHDRVVEPYCHGTSPRGAALLRAVQIRGSSSSGGYGFGKLWTVARMSAVRLSDQTFVPDDEDYNPNDSGMQHIHCRIEQ